MRAKLFWLCHGVALIACDGRPDLSGHYTSEDPIVHLKGTKGYDSIAMIRHQADSVWQLHIDSLATRWFDSLQQAQEPDLIERMIEKDTGASQQRE